MSDDGMVRIADGLALHRAKWRACGDDGVDDTMLKQKDNFGYIHRFDSTSPLQWIKPNSL